MKIRKLICIALILLLCFSSFVFAVNAEEDPNIGYISICDYDSGQVEYYVSFVSNNEVMVSAEDIAKIIGYDYSLDDNGISLSSTDLYRNIYIDLYGSVRCAENGFTVHIRHHNEKYYLPLEKLLYLARAQWCVEDNAIVVRHTKYTIFDFVDENFQWLYENKVTQYDLAMNGQSNFERGLETTLAFVFNDGINPLAFIPVVGALEIIDEQYEEAILQLSVDDMQFLNDYGQSEIEKFLEGSEFSQVKSYWDNAKDIVDLPKTILEFGDSIGEISKWIDSASETNKSIKFDKYNDLANLAPPELKAMSEKMKGISNALKFINVAVNVYEVATRSKDWNNDFLEQIDILTSFSEQGNVFPDAKRIKKIAKILIDKFVDITPFGKFKNIVYTGATVAKTFDSNIGKKTEALAFSHMVNCFIRVEALASFESADNYLSAIKNYGQLKSEDIKHMRNSYMLLLRTNLRNKAYIYYLNEHLNKQENWVNSQQALDIKASIAKGYALILKLAETEKFDRFLVVNSFDNMYVEEYGALRTKIPTSVFIEGEMPSIILGENQKQINIFLSNFSEVGIVSFDDIPQDGLLIDFGIYHTFFNIDNSLENVDWKDETKYYNVRLSKTYVEKAIKRFFDIDFSNHKSSGMYKYHDGYYYWEITGGDFSRGFSIADSLKSIGNGKYQATFKIYSDFGDDSKYYGYTSEQAMNNTSLHCLGSGTAVLKETVVNGKGTYILLKYNVKSQPTTTENSSNPTKEKINNSFEGVWVNSKGDSLTINNLQSSSFDFRFSLYNRATWLSAKASGINNMIAQIDEILEEGRIKITFTLLEDKLIVKSEILPSYKYWGEIESGEYYK